MGDTIQREVLSPQSWTNFGWVTYLYQGDDGVWSKAWQIESNVESNPYYVGIQIIENEEFLIGWLKLEIDKKTGVIEIVDHALTPDDFIIIDR